MATGGRALVDGVGQGWVLRWGCELAQTIKKTPASDGLEGFWRWSLAVPYFRTGICTIIGAKRFHFRGRDGIGWFPLALATRQTGCNERAVAVV